MNIAKQTGNIIFEYSSTQKCSSKKDFEKLFCSIYIYDSYNMVNYKNITPVSKENLCFSKFKSPNFRILGADINGYEPIRCFGDVSRRNFLFKYNATLYGDAFYLSVACISRD